MGARSWEGIGEEINQQNDKSPCGGRAVFPRHFRCRKLKQGSVQTYRLYNDNLSSKKDLP